ncbi:PH domain-containing protein [Verrucomicrobium sp. 3C]|uniref:PH domain-containing protein n=1 Tax=Verrucomicrobium sp. 3C TaxID=1134055 RepID=UPI000382A7F9|nr:PH domain-containing protein [Verrucomicrobium sp. 3C]
MSYIDKNLMNGENLVYLGKLHWVIFLRPIIWFIVAIMFFVFGGNSTTSSVGVLFILIALISAIDSFIQYRTSEFGITNKRLIAKAGFIRRRSTEVLLNQVEGIQVNQGILGRILGFGSITFGGTGGTKDPYPNIAAPFEFRKKAHEQIAVVQGSK